MEGEGGREGDRSIDRGQLNDRTKQATRAIRGRLVRTTHSGRRPRCLELAPTSSALCHTERVQDDRVPPLKDLGVSQPGVGHVTVNA